MEIIRQKEQELIPMNSGMKIGTKVQKYGRKT